jgi:hypothetical protein
MLLASMAPTRAGSWREKEAVGSNGRERATGLRCAEHHRRNGGEVAAAESREGEGGGGEEESKALGGEGGD